MSRPLLPASAVALLVLGACSADVTVPPGSRPIPRIQPGTTVAACPAPAGSASLVLDVVGAQVTLGEAGMAPVNNVEVSGTATGLGATDAVVVALVPLETNCPLFGTTVATVAGDGSFTVRMDIGDRTEFRVVAIALPQDTMPVLACTPAEDCLGAAGVTPSGVSGSLEVVVE